MDFDEIDLDLDAGITVNLTRESANAYFMAYPETYSFYAEKMPVLWELLNPEPVVIDQRSAPRIKILRDRKPKGEAYTMEIVERIARGCTSRREFIRRHGGAYQYCRRHGIDVGLWLPTKHERLMAEARGLVALVGLDVAMRNADPAMRQWMRDHKDLLCFPESDHSKSD